MEPNFTTNNQRSAMNLAFDTYDVAFNDAKKARRSLRLLAVKTNVEWLLSEMSELLHALRVVSDELGQHGSDAAVCHAISECVDVAYTAKRVAGSLCNGGGAMFEAFASVKSAGREELEEVNQLDGLGEHEYQKTLKKLKAHEAESFLKIFNMVQEAQNLSHE